MKKLKKSLVAIIFALVLTMVLSASASAADVGRVTGLKASAISNNSVTLTWNAIAAADGYRIQVRQDGGAWTTLSDTLTTNSYTAKNLKLGSSYSFKVNAYDIVEVKLPIIGVISSEKDHASYSTEVSVSHTIGKVTGLKVVSATATKVKLNWAKVTDAEGYVVQKKVDGKWKNVKTTTDTTYIVTGLKTNTTTPFRVKAYATNSNGEKVYGSVSSTVNGTAKVPDIKNFTATVKSTSSVQLSWTKVSLTGYQIYRKTGSGDWKKIKTITKYTTNSFTDTSLKLGTKYQYKVRGYYKTDSKTYYGAFSEIKSATPSIGKVVGIEFNTFTTKNRAVITWDKVAGAQGYQVYDYTSGKAVKVATVTLNKATVSVADNQISKFKVRAYTKSSTGSTVTGALSALFEIYSTPAKVMNLDYETFADDSITLKWNKVDIAHGYRIEVINNATAKWQTYTVATENNYTITDISSLPGTNFRVSAYVRNNGISLYGEASNIVTVRIIPKPDIFLTDTSADSVTLTWTPISVASTYILEKYSFEENAWKQLKETADTMYIDKSDSAMSGMYRVYAKTSDGSRSGVSEEIVAYSEGISVTQDGASQTITWPAVNGATKYRIYIKSTYGDRGFLGSIIPVENKNTATITLTPDSLQSLVIHGYASNGDYVGCAVSELLIKTDKFLFLDKSHAHYDHSINSQLLYLVDAINKSKHETNEVTVSASSAVAYSTDKFYVNNRSFNGSSIESLLTFINGITGFNKDSGDLAGINFSGTETSKETLTFDNGIAKNSEGKSVNLANYIDPSEEESAYLFGSTDPSAWREGVKSLTVTPTTDGGYKYVVMLYKEEYGTETNLNEAPYHKGLSTTVASMGQVTSVSVTNELTTVGDTTITAVINADGTLDSYQVVSPYTMMMRSPVNGIVGIDSFGMQINGSIATLYTFTR